MTLSLPCQIKTKRFLPTACLFFLGVVFCPFKAVAISLDPYPVYDSIHDETSISFFCEERPSYFWVNEGVPDAFFNVPNIPASQLYPVNQLSSPNQLLANVAYQINGIEYGVRMSRWITDQWRVTGTIPFEANALVTAPVTQTVAGLPLISASVTQTIDHFGDMELGSTYLVLGQRQKGDFIGVDGWVRFATGTNPFTQTYPLLSSGRGTSSEAFGVVAGQRLWNQFWLYEIFHYETTQPLQLTSTNTAGFVPGTFQWPDNMDMTGRVEWDVLQKGQRQVTLYYQYSGRISGLMTLNGQPQTYGQSYQLELVNNVPAPVAVGTTNQLFWSGGGAVFKIDKEFTLAVDVSYFPVYFIQQFQNQPNNGLLLSLSLIFRPF
jgi:hypothetical protein